MLSNPSQVDGLARELQAAAASRSRLEEESRAQVDVRAADVRVKQVMPSLAVTSSFLVAACRWQQFVQSETRRCAH